MTLKELSDIIAGLPEEWDDVPVFLGGSPALERCRAVCVVPATGGDAVGARIELRSAVVYLPGNRPLPADQEHDQEHG